MLLAGIQVLVCTLDPRTEQPIKIKGSLVLYLFSFKILLKTSAINTFGDDNLEHKATKLLREIYETNLFERHE